MSEEMSGARRIRPGPPQHLGLGPVRFCQFIVHDGCRDLRFCRLYRPGGWPPTRKRAQPPGVARSACPHWPSPSWRRFLGAIADRGVAASSRGSPRSPSCASRRRRVCGSSGPEESYLLLALILVAIANVGFEFGGVFYNALMPELAPRHHWGRISGWAWGAWLPRGPAVPGDFARRFCAA